MEDCIFCGIIARQIPAKIIYEDDHILAFDDIDPKAPIHKLIIPKQHIATLNDITLNEAPIFGQLFLAAKHIAQELGIAEEGYRTLFNCNAGGGQLVYHIHLHLLGGRQMQWPPG